MSEPDPEVNKLGCWVSALTLAVVVLFIMGLIDLWADNRDMHSGRLRGGGIQDCIK